MCASRCRVHGSGTVIVSPECTVKVVELKPALSLPHAALHIVPDTTQARSGDLQGQSIAACAPCTAPLPRGHEAGRHRGKVHHIVDGDLADPCWPSLSPRRDSVA